jgi:transposase
MAINYLHYIIVPHIFRKCCIISEVIKKLWDVDLKTSRIYDILAELRLSHQKTHRDYANASPEEQKEFVETLKKKWIIPGKVKK